MTEKQVFPLVEWNMDGAAISTNIDTLLASMRIVAEEEKARPLVTEEDFAKKDLMVSNVTELEDQLKKSTIEIEAKFDTLVVFKSVAAEYKAILASIRIDGKKKIEIEKERIKTGIRNDGLKILSDHIATISAKIEPLRFSVVFGNPQPNLLDAMKNRKKFDAMRKHVGIEVDRVIAIIDQQYEVVEANLLYLRKHANDYRSLFPDTATIISKDADAFETIVQGRIDQHKREIAETARKVEEKRLADIETKRLADLETQRLADIETQRLADLKTEDTVEVEVAEVVSETEAENVSVEPVQGQATPAQTTYTIHPKTSTYQYPKPFLGALLKWKDANQISDQAISELDAIIKQHLV